MKLFIIYLGLMITGAINYFIPQTNNGSIDNPAQNNIILNDTLKKPTVALEKMILAPMTILYISDTTDMKGLSKVFERGYGELFAFISTNGLRPGKIMAFHLTLKDPVVVEVAVEIDKMPSVLTGRIKSRIMEGGDAVVAHYKGPYEEIGMAYNAISDWIRDNDRQAIDLPFEAYLNDPVTTKDKYDLKTDVYQLIK